MVASNKNDFNSQTRLANIRERLDRGIGNKKNGGSSPIYIATRPIRENPWGTPDLI
jgi:hypothetical protein